MLANLLQNKFIPNLEKISIRNCKKITDQTLDLVLNLKNRKLIELDIGENNTLNFDIKHITFCPQILNVTGLREAALNRLPQFLAAPAVQSCLQQIYIDEFFFTK